MSSLPNYIDQRTFCASLTLINSKLDSIIETFARVVSRLDGLEQHLNFIEQLVTPDTDIDEEEYDERSEEYDEHDNVNNNNNLYREEKGHCVRFKKPRNAS